MPFRIHGKPQGPALLYARSKITPEPLPGELNVIDYHAIVLCTCLPYSPTQAAREREYDQG